ncbi:Fc.00g088160.m01.CDS01 [Cosmosporella sp. VM-42]
MTLAGATQITKVLHRASYASIDPSRPELSQRGRTVLVTGSSSGIGLAIARAFAKAGAETVILTGRRHGVLTEATNKLREQLPKTKFIGRPADIADPADGKGLWDQLATDGILVDVLVLNAARLQSKQASIIELGQEEVWADYTANVGSHLAFADYFYHQKSRDTTKKLALLNVSSMAAHDFDHTPHFPSYSATKNAGAMLMQEIAHDIAPDDMQVLSFHPGIIYTDLVKSTNTDYDSYHWDEEDLPGYYAVWAVSDEAKFLHGKFTWAAWDVDELRTGELRRRINDHNYLKVGILGL